MDLRPRPAYHVCLSTLCHSIVINIRGGHTPRAIGISTWSEPRTLGPRFGTLTLFLNLRKLEILLRQQIVGGLRVAGLDLVLLCQERKQSAQRHDDSSLGHG